jgi:hypothetical protein
MMGAWPYNSSAVANPVGGHATVEAVMAAELPELVDSLSLQAFQPLLRQVRAR